MNSKYSKKHKLKIDISVVIVTYNSEDHIIKCLKSIYCKKNANISIETIIIDNNSKDNTLNLIRDNFPNLKVLINNKNKGFSNAVNLGFRKSRGKNIFLLNPDTKVFENTLEKLLFKINNSNYKVIAPKISNNEGVYQLSRWKFPNLITTIFGFLYLDNLLLNKNYFYKTKNEIFEAECVSGAAMLINKKLGIKVGLFNESLFWDEDIDFCKRLSKHEFKILYFPHAEVIHYGGMSSKQEPFIKVSNQFLSKIKYFQLHHSKIEQYIIYFVIILVVIVKISITLLLSPFKKNLYKRFDAYCKTLILLIKRDFKIQL